MSDQHDPTCKNCQEPESVHGIDGYYCENFAPAQPRPVPNGGAPIHDMVAADQLARKAHGIKKYGVALQAGNGRDALQDAYEESLDASVYLKQAMEEREAARAALLRACELLEAEGSAMGSRSAERAEALRLLREVRL